MQLNYKEYVAAHSPFLVVYTPNKNLPANSMNVSNSSITVLSVVAVWIWITQEPDT